MAARQREKPQHERDRLRDFDSLTQGEVRVARRATGSDALWMSRIQSTHDAHQGRRAELFEIMRVAREERDREIDAVAEAIAGVIGVDPEALKRANFVRIELRSILHAARQAAK
jgi:hypothetical protein